MNQFAVTGIATFNPGLGYNFVPTVVIESPIQSVVAKQLVSWVLVITLIELQQSQI